MTTQPSSHTDGVLDEKVLVELQALATAEFLGRANNSLQGGQARRQALSSSLEQEAGR